MISLLIPTFPSLPPSIVLAAFTALDTVNNTMADVEKGNGAGNAAGYAGGGQFRGATSFTPRATPIGNPGALGLFSFAGTTFLLSLYNVNARGITTPNVVLGMAIFTGGLAQLLAGMWEFPRGNQFGATGKFLCSTFISLYIKRF